MGTKYEGEKEFLCEEWVSVPSYASPVGPRYGPTHSRVDCLPTPTLLSVFQLFGFASGNASLLQRFRTSYACIIWPWPLYACFFLLLF